MAGAGIVTEKIRPICVAPILEIGGKFLKWDDQDVGTAVLHVVKVDPKGHVLYWRPEDYSKETEVLEVIHIKDVRSNQFARNPKDFKVRESLKTNCVDEDATTQERTITICYGYNMVDVSFVNFVAPSAEEADEWSYELFSIMHNLLELNSSTLKSLERFHTRITVTANQDGEFRVKSLVKHFSNNKEERKRVYDGLSSVGFSSGKKMMINVKDFTFDKFLSFYDRLCARHDLDQIFSELGSKNKPYLTTEQLVDFLNNSQRDPRLNEILYPYFDRKRALELITAYETSNDFINKGYMSVEGLTRFLMSDDNIIISKERLSLHQDMNAPLSHYFINSSHNTYLTGHQLTGKSSVEIYRQVLLAGCRCIELDCWDGKTDEQEPTITHGMTMCTVVPFKDVIEAIAESAFKTSEFPVILSFENHCSSKQQAKMATYCVNIFGEMLLNRTLDEYPLEPGKMLPTPKVLKRKILIKNKKRIPKGVTSSETDARLTQATEQSLVNTADTDGSIVQTGDDNAFSREDSIISSADNSIVKEPTTKDPNTSMKEEVDEAPEEDAATELSALVNYIQPVHFRSFLKAEKDNKAYEMSSLSENTATNLLKEHPIEFVNYNKRQLSRVYPKGSRVSSDNYMPQVFWNTGCQMVALNFQTLDLAMMLNLGKFEYNARSGYLLKPEFMCRSDRAFDPFAESTVDGIIAGTIHVRIISGQCLTEKKTGSYVEVDMFGLPADTVRRKFRTKVVTNNGINPFYDEEPFVFKKVILPTLAVLRLSVYEENGKLIGHRVLPVGGLSPGYRHIKLRSEAYQPLALPTLFVHIVTKDYVPSAFADFADALSNPIQYLNEIDKRSQQLAALLIDEDETSQTNSTASDTAEATTPIGVRSISAKRGSIASVASSVTSASERDSKSSRSTTLPIDKDSNASGRAHSFQHQRSASVGDKNQVRSKSTGPDELRSMREELLDLKAPTIDDLTSQKNYLKLKQKYQNELMALQQKHAKEKTKVWKELEGQMKKLRLTVEKEKILLQKRQAKVLKKGEKDGRFRDVNNLCLQEMSEFNMRMDSEVDILSREHRTKLVNLLNDQYNEQLTLAKSHIDPKVSELIKMIDSHRASDKKKLDDRHTREIAVLKKDQDRFNRGELKSLSKDHKDKGELQRLKREQNRKHIEQSVKERQMMKGMQDKETDDLMKQYETLLDRLDKIRTESASELETFCSKRNQEHEQMDLASVYAILVPPEGLGTSSNPANGTQHS